MTFTYTDKYAHLLFLICHVYAFLLTFLIIFGSFDGVQTHYYPMHVSWHVFLIVFTLHAASSKFVQHAGTAIVIIVAAFLQLLVLSGAAINDMIHGHFPENHRLFWTTSSILWIMTVTTVVLFAYAFLLWKHSKKQLDWAIDHKRKHQDTHTKDDQRLAFEVTRAWGSTMTEADEIILTKERSGAT